MNATNTPNVLVLGATGKVGGATLRTLLAEAPEVHAIAGVRDSERAAAVLPAGVELRRADLDDRASLDAALVGVDRLLLLTGYSVNMLKQSKRALDAARDAGVRHVVHVGASGHETAEVAHWGWHRMVEAYVEQLGFGFTHLQPEAFMQNLTAFGWLNADGLVNPIGDAVWSWVDAEDVGALAAAALRHPDQFAGQTWRMGYEAASMAELASALGELRGHPLALRPLAPETFFAHAVEAGADPAYMACVRDQFRMNADGQLPGADATFNPTAFERAVGRPPRRWSEVLPTLV